MYWDERNTVPEFFSKVVKKLGDKKCFGSRELLSEYHEQQSDGKLLRKVNLGDYKWFSYNGIDCKVYNVAKGLLLNGVNPKDNVVIYSETRLEWMISALALLRIGELI